MKESVTYQAIVEEGVQKGEQKWKVQEVRHVVIKIGTKNTSNNYSVFLGVRGLIV